MTEIAEQCVSAFKEQFGSGPDVVVQAPGRVNLIGEHTDYNDGFVFPAAIDRWAVFAARARSDQNAVVHSLAYGDRVEFSTRRRLRADGHWSDYVKGMVSEFRKLNLRIGGFDAVLAGNVPLGAGLSSSAAVEMAVGRCLLELNDIAMPGPRLAQLGQSAENQFVGVNCGIMDQFISANGRAGHALFLDCRDLSFDLVPMGAASPNETGAKIVICDSGVGRELASSAYNNRRAACENGVKQLSTATGKSFKALRDVELDELESYQGALTEEIYKRCRHVVSENHRAQLGVSALKNNDLETFGAFMRASHESLKTDYEVSGKELDLLVDLALAQPGVYGARMTGAGFGGCTVNLVEPDAVDGFVEAVSRDYAARSDYKAKVYVCEAVNGVERV